MPNVLQGNVQDAPIKNNPLGKYYISAIVADFFTKFTDFAEQDSGHISSKFCYIMW